MEGGATGGQGYPASTLGKHREEHHGRDDADLEENGRRVLEPDGLRCFVPGPGNEPRPQVRESIQAPTNTALPITPATTRPG